MCQHNAQAQVLATTELLELVCLCLDAKSLFPIQRVCQRWKSLINNSVRLQERMFLRASCDNRQCPPHAVRLVLGAPHTTDELTSIPTGRDSEVTLCPVLEIATQFVRTHPTQIAASCTQSALRGSPSWHKMLLTAPPCKEVTVALWWRIGESMRGSIYLHSVTNPDGLRFEDVVKATFSQTSGNWKAMPDGKLLPLSEARNVTLHEFLERKAGGDVRMMESTSVFFLTVV